MAHKVLVRYQLSDCEVCRTTIYYNHAIFTTIVRCLSKWFQASLKLSFLPMHRWSVCKVANFSFWSLPEYLNTYAPVKVQGLPHTRMPNLSVSLYLITTHVVYGNNLFALVQFVFCSTLVKQSAQFLSLCHRHIHSHWNQGLPNWSIVLLKQEPFVNFPKCLVLIAFHNYPSKLAWYSPLMV